MTRKIFLTLLFLPSIVLASPMPNISALNTTFESLLGVGSKAADRAQELLKAKWTDLGLTEASHLPFEAANFTVVVDEECSKVAEANLERDAYRKTLLEQAESAALFLSMFHARMLGSRGSLFTVRKVRLCTDPVSPNHADLGYDSFTRQLTLYMGSRLGRAAKGRRVRRTLHTWTSEELCQSWKSGEHLEHSGLFIVDKIDQHKNPVRKYWIFIDPIGEARTAIRELLFPQREKAFEQISQIHRNPGKRSELVGELTAFLAEKDRDALNSNLKNSENPKATEERLIEDWESTLSSSTTVEDMITAVQSQIGQMAEGASQVDVDRWQVGLVNVENLHQIMAELVTGRVKQYAETVTIPETTKIKVRQFGLVNVSTTDLVKARVFWTGAVDAHALARATWTEAVRTFLRPNTPRQ